MKGKGGGPYDGITVGRALQRIEAEIGSEMNQFPSGAKAKSPGSARFETFVWVGFWTRAIVSVRYYGQRPIRRDIHERAPQPTPLSDALVRCPTTPNEWETFWPK